ncbi:MAG: VOC family protein [Thermoplasmatota archaeon]
MTAHVRYVPQGYLNLTPYLVANPASKAIEFYTKVFGAKEALRMPGPNNTVGHAELLVGDSRLMVSDENLMPDGILSPSNAPKPAVGFFLYVEHVDEVFARALAHGAKSLRPLKNQFYGDRTGSFRDPWGHVWTVATHVEDVPPDEMARRAAAQAPP